MSKINVNLRRIRKKFKVLTNCSFMIYNKKIVLILLKTDVALTEVIFFFVFFCSSLVFAIISESIDNYKKKKY